MEFLSLLDDRKRTMAKLMVDKGDISSLDRLMAGQEDHILQIYEAWKTKRNAQADPADPSPSSPSNTTQQRFDIVSMTDRLSMNSPSSSRSPVREDVTNMPNVSADVFAKLSKELTVVFLGETGVGKSTFVNGMVNYLKYATLHEAQEKGVEILIKSFFTHTDADFNRLEVKCEPTVKVEKTIEENEETAAGQSCTQYPKSYKFIWSYGGEKRVIRIIDTPGVGDVRGLPQEKENFKRILSFLADFKQINAICILLKPNEPRLTLNFRYCINELLCHFHVSAARNIIFCFTNARSTLYRPGETLPSLEAHLKVIQDDRKVEIPLNSKTMFSFDNESFRFLCALNAGARFTKKEKEDFNGSWVKTVEETFRLFERIAELEAHDVDKTLSVNNIRSVIFTMARPLAGIAKTQMMNTQLIEDKVREIEDMISKGEDLKGRLYVNQATITVRPIDHPITVCTSAKCVEHKRFNSDPNLPVQTVYKTHCHKRCYLEGVEVERLPNPALQRCTALYRNIDSCNHCGCPWSLHMHITYMLEENIERVTDQTIQKSINNNENIVRTARAFIDNEKRRKNELIKESEQITSYCSAFAAFLKKDCILPYNDAYQDYVNQLIKEERDKGVQNNKMLAQLEEYKAEYEQKVKLLEASKPLKGNEKENTIKEIYDMVDKLKKLKNCGKLLEEIQKLEMLSVRKQQIYQTTSVNLNGGWLDRFQPKREGRVNTYIQKFGRRVI